MKRIFKRFLPALAILCFLFFLYPDVVFFKKTLETSQSVSGVMPTGQYGYPEDKKVKGVTARDPGASAWQYVPLFELTLQQYKEKKMPLWNPYSGLGAPLAAQMQSSGFFLPQILIAALQGFDFSWDFYLLLRLFAAGIFTYLFCRKIKLSKKASLLASFFFMGNGYFLFFVNMSHLNVEIILPFFLYAIESFLQDRKWWQFLLIALASHFLVTGGFPKAAFFAFAFGGLYLLFRFFQDKKKKETAYAVLAIGLGTALSSFLLFPFVEYLQNAAHPHTSDISESVTAYNWKTLITLFFPNFYGNLPETWIARNPVMPFVSLLAWPLLVFAFSNKKYRKLTLFLAAIALFYILKTIGFPLVQWIQNLPILKMQHFPKYLFVEFAFSLAVLAAIGFETIRRKKIWFYAIIIILLIESASIFWFPRNFRNDPFEKPPYVAFLQKQQKQKGDFRILSTQNYLAPNTASAFQIADIRSNDALYPKNYYRVIKEKIYPEIYDRFQGDEAILDFDDPLLDILNVRYLIAAPETQPPAGKRHWLKAYEGEDARIFENPEAEEKFIIGSGDKKYLVFSQIYFPGFKAKLYGKETPILKADETISGFNLPLMAVEISQKAGQKETGQNEIPEITISYEPNSFKAGELISLFTLVIIGFYAKLVARWEN